MFENYLKTAFRVLIRQKSYTIINITGLAIGIAACIFIIFWIADELNYDTYNTKANRIYRVIVTAANSTQPRTPHQMAQAMVNDFPDVESAVSISPIFESGMNRAEVTFRYKNIVYDEKNLFSVDTSFFEVFTFKFIEGDKNTALKVPGGLILTESTARKYFGSEPALGKSLLAGSDKIPVTITGVINDVPKNSHFTFDMLLSYVTQKYIDTQKNGGILPVYYTWDDFAHYNYIVLKPGVDPQKIAKSLIPWIQKYIKLPDGLIKKLSITFTLQPLRDIHLKSHIIWELGDNGNILLVYIFAAGALLIFIIASINFMNLCTARSLRRSREVGIRKAIGSSKSQLISQYLLESLILTSISIFMALLLVEIFMPFFNSITGKNFSLDLFSSGFLIYGSILILILLGLSSALYPALYLSSFKPLKALKGEVKHTSSNIKVRKSLVILQFGISVVFIISAFTIGNQMQFLINKDMGFKPEQVMVVPLKDGRVKEKAESIKSILLNNPGISDVAFASNIPGGQFNTNQITNPQGNNSVNCSEVFVSTELIRVLGIKMKEGRSFSGEFSGDTISSFILNEEACKAIDLKEPIGKEVVWNADYPGTIRGRVIGVAGDFNFHSLHERISPLIIVLSDSKYRFNYILLKVKPVNITGTIEFIGNTWKQFNKDVAFSYSFLDNDFENQYLGEKRMQLIFRIFSFLSVIIACLGLFGLSAYATEQRTKEIAVRKVHGATITQLFIMMSMDFGRLVLWSLLFAWPVAYLLMKNWLTNFPYHTNIQWIYFLVASFITFTIAILTIAYQTLKVANSNPVNSLKYE